MRTRLTLAVTAVALITGAWGSTAFGASPEARPTGTLTIADWEFSENDGRSAALKGYEQANPGAKLEFQTMSYNSYVPTIKTQIGGGGGPDVMVLLDSTFADLQKAGALAPITSVTPEQEAQLRAENDLAKVDGERFGIIWETVIYGMLYNKDLLNQAGITEAPKDFASFLEACKAVKDKTGKWGFAARNMLAETESWYEDFTGTWIAGYGGGWSDASGNLTIDSPENIQAVTDFATVYNSGCMQTGVPASVFRPSYKNGDVAIMMDNADAGFTYTDANDILTNELQGSGPLPMPTEKSGRQELFLSINANSENNALAQDFMNWLLEPESQMALVAATAPQTTSTMVTPSDEFTAAHPWAVHYYDQPASGVSLLLNGRPELTPQLAETVMPYVARVLDGQMTAADALKEAQQAAVAAMP
jgi:multiple sugar transport system substrate-binding protein